MTRAPILTTVALALTLPLTGCGTASEPAPTNTAAVSDDYATRVRALAPGQRDGVLFRAIRDAGRVCQQVTRSVAIPDVADAPAWAATCDDGAVWVVALNPGGVATVTSASGVDPTKS